MSSILIRLRQNELYMNDNRFKDLPSVSRCLDQSATADLINTFGHGAVAFALRKTIDSARSDLSKDLNYKAPNIDEVIELSKTLLSRLASPEARHVINGTGIILHTGIGRAPLSDKAVFALSQMNRFSALELDLESGERGRRDTNLESILRELTGAEAATVVNNNAAATFIALNVFSSGKDTIVSRGQLIEIGGSYRLPDIMGRSNARLREVGTTNRTHLSDYRAALSVDTGAIIHVHTSNYKISGFTSTPSLEELVQLAREFNVPVLDDLGSGALVSLSEMGLPASPTVRDGIKAGADLVCFSGDKLIGGPQAGIIVGKQSWIDKIRANPFFRMFRVDKLCLAALEATLLDFMTPKDLGSNNNVYALATRSLDELHLSAQQILDALPKGSATITESEAYLGGGTMPDQALKSVALSLKSERSAQSLARALRLSTPSVLGRIEQGSVMIDLRTVFPSEIETLVNTLKGQL